MLKPSLFVALGIALGIAMAVVFEGEPLPDLGPSRETVVAEAADALAGRLAALEAALATEAERRTNLEAKLADLGERLSELTPPDQVTAPSVADVSEDVRTSTDVGDAAGPRGARFAAMREWRSPENRQSRLIEAGFSPEQAQSLIEREARTRMDVMNASYEARREGESFDPTELQREAQAQLRTELGDNAYERYLEAMGQPTSVSVFEVIGSSAGQTAGLQSGDEIVGYNGERVFSLSDLRALTIAGEPGETVAVDIVRDGQPMQLYMPRGPLGITGGGRGRNFGFIEALPVPPP